MRSRWLFAILLAACTSDLGQAVDSGARPNDPSVRRDAAIAARGSDGQIAVDARVDVAPDGSAVENDGAVTPASCDERTTSREGLLLWLEPTGIEANGESAMRWHDRDNPSRAVTAAGGPRLRNDFFGPGLDGVYFDGDDDRMSGRVPIDDRTALTIALVTSSSGRAPGVEWCCRADETGCSGTYHTALMVEGERDWGGVLLGPSQREVSLRFGNNGKSYSEEPEFYERRVFGASGYGSCRSDPARDPNVAWTRPTSIGTTTTVTVATLAARTWRLYVDGEEVWTRPAPSMGGDAVDAARDLRIGEGLYGRNWEGVAGAVIVYDRALAESELASLHHSLGCTFLGRSIGGGS